ncbi:MAG: carboxypeptidase-like regulatory domain-containing protein [Bacteroides sp.]
MRLTDLLENNGYYFRKMKFCKLKTFLLTILFGSISTGILAQTNKLSIHKKETPIIQVLNELEKKSNYVFFFSDDVKTELTRRVTISATEKPLKQILDEILNRTTLTYKINDRQVTINRRDEKMPAKQNRVAKNVRFKGSVKDAENSMPLMNVNIYIPELGIGTSTDENGLFSIVLPTGNYSCRMSYIGYGTHTEKINIRQETQQEFMLQSDTKLDEVVVLANKKDENVSRTNMGVEKLTMNEIKRMPALMGEVDVIKAIQLLPGVQATAEGGSGYSVRGGSADQNLIVLDNATVYNASHMFGFFSFSTMMWLIM